MNKGKPIHVGQSSLIGLKAELYKKREEIKNKKSKFDGQEYIKGSLNKDILKTAATLKTSIAIQKLKNASKNTKYDDDENIEEELRKSKLALERKSDMYAKMCKSGIETEEDDLEGPYLVNFNQKVVENHYDKFEENGDELVEYTDSFGRTRKCQKRELPALIKLDKDIKVVASYRAPETQLPTSTISKPLDEHPQSDDSNLNSKTSEHPTHFQNVEEKEIRDLGVGYFAFSQEENQRKSQMDALNKLREQTILQRKAKQNIKSKQKARLKERLENLMKSKNIKRNINEIVSSDDDEEDDIEQYTKKQKLAKEQEEDKKRQELLEANPPKPRPWDKGKMQEVKIQKKAPWKNWLEARREDREPEFAPPSSYNDSSQPPDIDGFLNSYRNKS